MDKYLSFRVRNELYGLDILTVREINRNIVYTPVPRSNESIVGVFNMRGQIVTLFDLAKILGYECSVRREKITCIILKNQRDSTDMVGFLIDKTGDVIDVSAEECERPPGNVAETEYKYIEKVARLNEEILRVISPEKILMSL